MTMFATAFADITFLDVCLALVAVGVAERAMLRFAPSAWLKTTGHA